MNENATIVPLERMCRVQGSGPATVNIEGKSHPFTVEVLQYLSLLGTGPENAISISDFVAQPGIALIPVTAEMYVGGLHYLNLIGVIKGSDGKPHRFFRTELANRAEYTIGPSLTYIPEKAIHR